MSRCTRRPHEPVVIRTHMSRYTVGASRVSPVPKSPSSYRYRDQTHTDPHNRVRFYYFDLLDPSARRALVVSSLLRDVLRTLGQL